MPLGLFRTQQLHFFLNQGTSSTTLPKFYPNLPRYPLACRKRGKLKNDHQKKNVCTSILGAIFVESKEHTAILRKFTHISQISTDCARIFTKSKRLWVRLHSRLQDQCFHCYSLVFRIGYFNYTFLPNLAIFL